MESKLNELNPYNAPDIYSYSEFKNLSLFFYRKGIYWGF